jgi:hypothetical protein
LQELPKLRPADQIDISEQQLVLIKEVFDKVKVNEQVDSVNFFLNVRKHPKLKQMSSAIARDPEGQSRIPRETFQEVFDRMEQNLKGKMFTWPTIVEYFTKRGRPLTKEEIEYLQNEEKMIAEMQREETRRLELENTKRMEKLMEAV